MKLKIENLVEAESGIGAGSAELACVFLRGATILNVAHAAARGGTNKTRVQETAPIEKNGAAIEAQVVPTNANAENITRDGVTDALN